MKVVKILIGITFGVSLLTACGGGGGGQNTPTQASVINSSSSTVTSSSSSVSSSVSSASSSSLPSVIELDSALPKATNYLADTSRDYVYITHKTDLALSVIDIKTGKLVQSIKFELMPEKMFLSNDKSRLYVALSKQEHSYYWFDSQSGAIAVIDLSSLKLIDTFQLTIDPYDLVVTSKNKLLVSGGSGQWTNINAYDATNGNLLGSAAQVRQQSNIALSANENTLYALDMENSASAFQKFNISGVGIESAGFSAYQTVHRYNGDMWVTPDGKYLISRGGDVYLSADFSFVASLTDASQTVTDISFDTTSNLAIIVLSDSNIMALNLISMQVITTTKVFGQASLALINGGSLVVFTEQGGVINIIRQAHPCAKCATNKAPTAAFSVSPSQGDTTTVFAFDAAASSDPDKDDLVYRWDVDADGVWDTDFSSDKIFKKKFITAGTKYIRLQVKDTSGFTASKTQVIEVVSGKDFGTTIIDSSKNIFDFSANFMQRDLLNSKLYFSDRGMKRVYVVDAETGLTEKYFSFEAMPERMAVSPDGHYLYVVLATKDHNAYWFENLSGYIGVIDLDVGALVNVFPVNTDPFALAATTNKKLLVSSGSGQWTTISAYDTDSGNLLGTASTYEGAMLAVDTTGNYLFSADRELSPSDIYKYDVSGKGILSGVDSPYHGDRRTGGNVWVTPNGKYVIAGGGDVFQVSDLTYVQDLTPPGQSIQSLAFDTVKNTVVVIQADKKVMSYILDGFSEATQLAAPSDPRELAYVNGAVYLLKFEEGKYKLQKL